MCICICTFSLWKVYANVFYLLNLGILRLAQDNQLCCIKHRNISQFYNKIYLYSYYWKSFSSLLWRREQDNLFSLKYSSTFNQASGSEKYKEVHFFRTTQLYWQSTVSWNHATSFLHEASAKQNMEFFCCIKYS